MKYFCLNKVKEEPLKIGKTDGNIIMLFIFFDKPDRCYRIYKYLFFNLFFCVIYTRFLILVFKTKKIIRAIRLFAILHFLPL